MEVKQIGSRLYPQKCKICGGKSYGEYCKLCEYTLLQIDEIINLYINGTPPERMDDAIAEFDRIYYGNLRLRAFYSAACETVYHVVVFPDEPIGLIEPNFSTIPELKILHVLEKSGVIQRKNGEIYPGSLLEKLMRVRLSGYNLNASTFSKQLRVIYSVLTMSIAKTLLEDGEFKPQVILGIFRMISSHIMQNMGSTTIPREIPRSTWRRGFRNMARRTEIHVQWDLLGLTPNVNPRIVEDYNPQKEQYISKECMLYYYEYIRDRIREREYERER